MGLLTDFVIAGEDEAAAIAAAVRPAERWPTLECKGVDVVKLSTLVAAATSRAADDELQDAFELAAGDEAEGPWVPSATSPPAPPSPGRSRPRTPRGWRRLWGSRRWLPSSRAARGP